jgi:hypothetical protein
MPAARAAAAITFCTTDSCRWNLDGGPHRRLRQIRAAGNTNCHFHSVDAAGYFRSSANGRTARPTPATRSRSCSCFTSARSPQPLPRGRRQHRAPILLALTAPEHDLIEIEVHVLDAKFDAILQPKPGAVQERDDDPGHSGQRVQKPPDLLAAQDHRQARRRAGTRHLLECAEVVPPHLAIQEKQRAERLVLRRSTDPLTDGQPLQKRRDLRRAHRGRMLLLVTKLVHS